MNLHKLYNTVQSWNMFLIGTLVRVGRPCVLGFPQISSAHADRKGGGSGGGVQDAGVGGVTVGTEGARVMLMVAHSGH